MLTNFNVYSEGPRTQKIAEYLHELNSLSSEEKSTLYWLPRLLADNTFKNLRFHLKDPIPYQCNCTGKEERKFIKSFKNEKI